MSTDYKDFPWRPGMLYREADGSTVRLVNVPALPEYPKSALGDGMAPGVATHDDGLCWYIFDGGVEGGPDLTDPATIGALAGVVRELYGEPLMHVAPSGGAWLTYRTVEDDVRGERQDVLLTDGSWYDTEEWDNDHPPIRGATEPAAWLAAHHAHPSAASPASPPVRGDAADLDTAGVSAADIEEMRK